MGDAGGIARRPGRPRRLRARAMGVAVASLAVTAAVAACSGSPSDSATSPPLWPTQPPATVRPVGTLVCSHAIDHAPPPAGFTTVLGVVALPAAPAYAALGAARESSGHRGLPYFAKTGLLVRTGARFSIEVQAGLRGHVGIGWSSWSATGPATRFGVPGCQQHSRTGWLSYAGGYWTDKPRCATLIVRSGDEVRRVQVGVGSACPGQQPPPA